MVSLSVVQPNQEPLRIRTSSARVHEKARHFRRIASTSGRLRHKVRRRGQTTYRSGCETAYQIAKRGFDVTVGVSVLMLSIPLLIFVALAIKLTDRGPVLFWQRRIGRWGQPFDFPKFRSMVVGADAMVHSLINHNHHGASITFKIKRDPRVTWIGFFLRRFSLDEFPQILCVLKGDMSLVGPRPALPREVENYTQEQRRRLAVSPGLTCIWQVSGRADVPFDKQVQMDVDYIESHNFWLDLKLVASTVPAVLIGRGAY